MFSHEKLIVHQKAIQFVAWAQPIIESLPRCSVRDQLDRASTSIPLNLAEGNVKVSPPDRARFLQIAEGSAVECAACLDVAVARKLRHAVDTEQGKQILEEIVKRLAALRDRLGLRFDGESGRVRENGARQGYGGDEDSEEEDVVEDQP